MRTSSDGIEILHFFEGLKLKAYPDPATGGAPWTIGRGETGPHVRPGLVWTQEQADAAFAERLAREFEPAVSLAAGDQTTQSQFDAMVCLAYNIGVTAFSKSTLVKLHRKGEWDQAADQFLVWRKAAGKVMLGLERRRAAERARYLGATGAESIEIGKAVS